MKINKSKFFVGALLISASIGVAGSITGTYAWYSYNTKSPVTYTGIATGSSQYLQVKCYGDSYDWKTSLSEDEFVGWSEDNYYAGSELKPVTFSKNMLAYTDDTDEMLKTSSFKGILSKGNPNYTTVGLGSGTASDPYSFFKTTIQLQCVDPADKDDGFSERKVYLSDITLLMDDDSLNIADSIRVYIANTSEHLFYLFAPGVSKGDAAAETKSINLFGNLDLDNDGNNDKGIYKDVDDVPTFQRESKYYFDEPDTDAGEYEDEIIYGVNGVTETFFYKDSMLSSFTNGKLTKTGKCMGITSADGDDPLTLDIWIYMQGWAASVEDQNIGAEFKLGMTFECQDLKYDDPE